MINDREKLEEMQALGNARANQSTIPAAAQGTAMPARDRHHDALELASRRCLFKANPCSGWEVRPRRARLAQASSLTQPFPINSRARPRGQLLHRPPSIAQLAQATVWTRNHSATSRPDAGDGKLLDHGT
jgi:hypothetical protein